MTQIGGFTRLVYFCKYHGKNKIFGLSLFTALLVGIKYNKGNNTHKTN